MAAWLKKISSNIFPIIDQVLVSGGNFLTVAICARLLSIPEQGKVGYIFSAYGAIVVINTTLIFQWASIKAPGEKDLQGYRSLLAGFQILAALPVSLLLAIFMQFLSGRSGWVFSPMEFGLLFLFILLQQLANYDRRQAYILADARRAAVSSLLVYPARIALLLLLKPAAAWVVLTLMAATALPPALITLRRDIRVLFTRFSELIDFGRAQLANSRWLLLSGPLDWLWANMPIYMLGGLAGLAAVGVLTAVNSIANIGNILLEILETEGAARMGRQVRQGEGELRKGFIQFLAFGLALWAAGMLVFLSAGGWVLKLAVGKTYADFGLLLALLWLGKLIFFLYRLNAVRRRTQGATQVVPLSYLAGCVALALMAVPLITRLGSSGAAWSYILSGIVILLAQEIAYYRIKAQVKSGN